MALFVDTSYTYFANRLLKTQSGEAVNTVDYTYDDLGGQMKTMVTRYGGSSSLATTTWNYDAHRGWLDSKIDHTGDGASYDYTAAGRISKRTWDRGAVTDYSYTHAGQLKLVNYTDSGIPVNTTPDIEYSYNRSGTLASVKDGTSSSGTIGTPRYTTSHFYVANHPLLPDYEMVAGLYTETKQIKRKWDGINRPGGYLVGTAANEDLDMETTWSYHASDGRISTILSESFETHTDTYSYFFGVAGQYSPNVVSGPQIYTLSAFQANTRLLDTIDNKTASGGATVSNYNYRYDNRGRRDRKDFTGTAFASATYDTYAYANTQRALTEGNRFLASNNTAVAALDFDYTYDDIGNRTTANHGGSGGSGSTTYTPSATNGYSAVTGFGGGTPVSYDGDGNLIALATKTFVYNAENQLIEVKNSGASLATFKYDYRGRRVEKVTPAKTERYLYDGWNLIAVYDTGATKTPLTTYTWGWDLSDSRQGAGGVGGLLMSCERGGAGWTYYHDGHGNVGQMVDQADGSVDVKMEYDPYGRVVAGAPTWELKNAFRFSSKFLDAETGLLYYGYRFFDPVHGRWLNRDPIGEQGGLNLYGFVGNDGVNMLDSLGLEQWHHLLPFAAFMDANLDVAMDPNSPVDINSEEYGWVFKEDAKSAHNRLHPEWERQWKAWIDDQPKPITKDDIDFQLKEMMEKDQFKVSFEECYGKQADGRYPYITSRQRKYWDTDLRRDINHPNNPFNGKMPKIGAGGGVVKKVLKNSVPLLGAAETFAAERSDGSGFVESVVRATIEEGNPIPGISVDDAQAQVNKIPGGVNRVYDWFFRLIYGE